MFWRPINPLRVTPGVSRDEREKERIQQLQAGSEEAFQWLVGEYAPPVYRLACRLLRNREDASDLTQEVFLKVFRSVGQFHGQASLRTWIYHIAVNAVWNQNRWWRRHRSAECALEAPEQEDAMENLAADPDSPDPLQLLLSREAQETVQRALGTLAESYRAVLVLREIEGLSYDELSVVLSLSAGTVKSRLARARHALKVALESEPLPETQAVPEWRTVGAD